MVQDFLCYQEMLLNNGKNRCKNKEYVTSRIKMKTCLLIALGHVLNVRLAATTKLPKKLLLNEETTKILQVSSAACKMYGNTRI